MTSFNSNIATPATKIANKLFFSISVAYGSTAETVTVQIFKLNGATRVSFPQHFRPTSEMWEMLLVEINTTKFNELSQFVGAMPDTAYQQFSISQEILNYSPQMWGHRTSIIIEIK